MDGLVPMVEQLEMAKRKEHVRMKCYARMMGPVPVRLTEELEMALSKDHVRIKRRYATLMGPVPDGEKWLIKIQYKRVFGVFK